MDHATLRSTADLDWINLRQHVNGALTKLLITKNNSESKNIDFYISCYYPNAYAEEHFHEETEEVFYFISGEGVFIINGERHKVSAGTVVHVPPNVVHGIINTGFENLIFVIAATPPEPRWTE